MVSKATKKFAKNKLPAVLKQRKEGNKIKQRKQMKDKKREKKRADAGLEALSKTGKANGVGQGGEGVAAAEEKVKDKLASMSMDEFFQEEFAVPERGTTGSSRGRKKRKRGEKEGDAWAAAEADENGQVSERSSESGDDEAHKDILESLKEKDPEFHRFMRENDPELLDFDPDADAADGLNELDMLEAEDENKDEDDEAEGAPKGKTKGKNSKTKDMDGLDEDSGAEAGAKDVDVEMVEKWRAAMQTKKSQAALKDVVLAFRAAAHGDDEDPESFKFRISTSDVYHQLVIAALTEVPLVLEHHLPIKENASGKVHIPTDSKKFRNLSPVLKTYTLAITNLLENLSDPATLKLTLKSTASLLPFILSFKKLIREIIRSVSAVWSDNANTESTRVSAISVLHRLVVIGDAGIRESALKMTYQALIRGCRQTTVHTIKGIDLMKRTAAVLWGIDASIGYTTGFTFIRQLAIHLRSSITNSSSGAPRRDVASDKSTPPAAKKSTAGKGKDAYKIIYNWQYIHSLDFWSEVLATHCTTYAAPRTAKGKLKEPQEPLQPLIYPLVQVSLGAARLIPTPKYFPLRFQIVRSLLKICRATGTFIPLAALLLEVLDSAELRRAPKPSPPSLKPIDFSVAISVNNAYLHTRVYQDGLVAQAVELLAEYFALHAKSVAFPELALAVTVNIKRWLKDVSGRGSSSGGGNRNGKANSTVAVLAQKIESQAAFITRERAQVDFAPNDREGVETFLQDHDWEKTPLGAYVVGQRNLRDERNKLIEEGRRERETMKSKEKGKNKKGKQKRSGRVDEEEDDDEESDVEMDDGSEDSEEDVEMEVEYED